MDMKTLRGKTREILIREMEETTGRLREIRFQMASQQLKQVRSVRELRRNIARLSSALHEIK